MDDVWKGLTVFLAAVIALISWQQYRLASEKLKLDLFEKRFSVFQAARRLLSQILTDGALNDMNDLWKYRAAVAEASFLYDSDVVDYLEKLDREVLELRYLDQRMKALPPGDERNRVVEKESAALAKLVDQLPQLKPRFAPYLKFRIWH